MIRQPNRKHQEGHHTSIGMMSFLFIVLLTTSLARASAPAKPSNLRCLNKYRPAGTGERPYFGWIVNDSDADEIQTGYQIIVAPTIAQLNEGTARVWDSGRVKSRKQNYIDFAGKSLLPATRYYWKVRTWDKDGQAGPYSLPQYFDTGLFKSADWQGSKWIKRPTEVPDDYTYFRKKIVLPASPIKRAIVYVSAVHNYELYINTKLISKGSVHHYPQYQYYHAYDVTAAFQPGKANVIASLTHWYGGGQGRAKSTAGFILKTIIEYADGRKVMMGTDSSWKQQQAAYWQSGQPRRNGEGIGYVDKLDSRKLIADWNSAAYNDAGWQAPLEIGNASVKPWINALQPDLTRVIEKEITPVSVKRMGEKKYLIDLGKIYAGMPLITFKGGSAGDTVSLRGGFVLNDDGSMSHTMDQHTNLTYSLTLNGSSSLFKPMVYLGYRYLEVENSPSELTQQNVKFIARHFELDASASAFTSSNPMLNKVWELMKYSLIVGAQEGFVDTPTREKGSFLGDGWSQAVPAMSVMYDRTMNDRVLTEFLNSQDQYWPDGRLNSVYPNVDGKRDIPDYTQSYLVWVWDYYMQTGNLQFLAGNYQRLKKVADYVATYRNPSTGLIHNLAGGGGPYEFGIIDWPPSMRYGYDVKTEARTVINAYAFVDFHVLSQIAGVLGNRADSISYGNQASAVAKAINEKLLNSKGTYHDGLRADLSASDHVSQHANMFPMAMGIVPAANRKAVAEEIKKQKMSVGMVTVRYLPEALGQADEGPHLIDLYTNTGWDGWAKNISQGASVTWESWDADKTNNSMSHPWGAAGLLGIEEYVLGIKVLSPQHNLIQVKPLDFGTALDEAHGILPTDKGRISVAWKREAGNYRLQLEIPVNVKAKVYLPKSGIAGGSIILDGKTVAAQEEGNYICVENIGSGKHTFLRKAD